MSLDNRAFWHFNQCLGRRKSSQNDDRGQEETTGLVRYRADTSNKKEKQSESLKQARKNLDEKNMVVITGVQGSGKTFLAKLLVTDLKKNGTEMKSVWISNIDDLLKNQTQLIGEFDIYVFDEIFYELQKDNHFEETINILKPYLNSTKNSYFIFTIPSYIWRKHSRCNQLESWLGEVRVDLDKRSKSEKRNILKCLMIRYDIPREHANIVAKLQDDLLKFTSNSIGFPALISSACKQSSEDEVMDLLRNPLQSMSAQVASMKNASKVEERGKYLILAYMSLKDGKMGVDKVDRDLLESLKIIFAPGFMDKDLDKYAESMVGFFLLRNEDDGSYEFDLNIMKKIVFVNLAKNDVLFVQMNCQKIYRKYIIPVESCPSDMDDNYAECFATI